MGLKGQSGVQGTRAADSHGAGDGGFKTGSVDFLKPKLGLTVLAKCDGPREMNFFCCLMKMF